jgi:hypothetical protein
MLIKPYKSATQRRNNQGTTVGPINIHCSVCAGIEVYD